MVLKQVNNWMYKKPSISEAFTRHVRQYENLENVENVSNYETSDKLASLNGSDDSSNNEIVSKWLEFNEKSEEKVVV